MKIWAKCMTNQKIMKDLVLDFEYKKSEDTEVWNQILTKFCHDMDISRPLIMSKHINELVSFSRTNFISNDFMDSFPYDKLEIEIFPEKKKKQVNELYY